MASRGVKPDPTKRKPGPVTPEEVELIHKLAAEGMSIADIAREVGVGGSTVSRVKKRDGLTVQAKHDNTAGTQAFSILARQARLERRAAADELYRLRTEMLLKVMRGEAKYKTVGKIAMGGEAMKEYDFIPPQDWQSETRGMTMLDTQIAKADDREDDQGLSRGLSMLEKFTEMATAIAGGTLPPPREGLIQE